MDEKFMEKRFAAGKQNTSKKFENQPKKNKKKTI